MIDKSTFCTRPWNELHIEEDGRHRVSLRIELRHPAALQTDQDGTLLWLKFAASKS